MSAVAASYSRGQRVILGLALPLAALAAWELSARLGNAPSYLVAPSRILATASDMLITGELWQHARASLVRALGGYTIGSIAGIAVGLLAGIARPVEPCSTILVSLTYPVPKIVILPILIAWLGAGDASKIAVVTAAVFYPPSIKRFTAPRASTVFSSGAPVTWALLRRRCSQGDPEASLPQVITGLRIGSHSPYRHGGSRDAEFAQRSRLLSSSPPKIACASTSCTWRSSPSPS
jgi:hypothetical protein